MYLQEAKCSVAFCYSIKEKLRKQEQQQKIQQAHLMRRRMALMSRNLSQTATPSTPAAPGTPQDAHTPKTHLNDNAQSSPMTGSKFLQKGVPPQMQIPNPQMQQQQPYQNDFQNHNQMPSRNGMPVPGGGMMMQQPGQQTGMPINTTQMPMISPQQQSMTVRTSLHPSVIGLQPPLGAIKAAKEAEELAKQQAQNNNNPLGFGAIRNQTPMPSPQQQVMQPRPQMSMNTGFNQRVGMQPQFRPQNTNQVSMMNQQHPNNPNHGSHEDLQKVINLLKREPQNNNGPGPSVAKKVKNTDQVLNILKKNPQLMATIIKNKKFNRAPGQQGMPQQQVNISECLISSFNRIKNLF